MSQLVIAARPQEIVRSRWQHSGRLLLSLGLSLIMVWTLLFAFSRRTLAAPTDTTISQRVQNSVITSTSAVTGTYGEALTVTLRFTVTASTVLTGPVYLSAQFPGVTEPLTDQLGFRFISYTNPIGTGGIETQLIPAGFVSATSGTAPSITTVITWTFDTITNSLSFPYVYDVPYQIRLAWDGVANLPPVVTRTLTQTLPGAILSWNPYTISDKKTAITLTVTPRTPDLSYSTLAYRLAPAMQSGANVVYTVTLKNGSNSSNFSPAYDLVVTDSLDADLVYGSAFPTPTGVLVVAGANTIITWTAPVTRLAPNTSWLAVVTATLPSTTANKNFTNTVLTAYTTQPGAVPDEATLTGTLSLVIPGRAATSGITISQRIQNAVFTSASAITGTYGESLTRTLRFTVTADTILTGPVQLTTTFPGVLETSNDQLGFRLLSRQNPITISAGTPALIPTDFVSFTSGTAPNITTVITWTFGGITNTSSITYVYEAAYQIRLVWDGVADLPFVTQTLPSAVMSWNPYTGNDKKTANTLIVTPLKPDLSYSTLTSRLVPAMQSGARVVYTVTLKNGNTAPGFSTAYDLVVTDSLDANLTYVSAFPTPTAVLSVTGANTIITWTAPVTRLASNTTWTAYVTATLPSPLAANSRYTNTLLSAYTTLSGTAPEEGYFTSIVSATMFGGITGTKQVFPTTNVRIGDTVTYTVRMTGSENTAFSTPIFTDTLPSGFHYQTTTLALTGGAELSGAPITFTAGANELLIWKVNDIPADGAAHAFTVTYVAGVTGISATSSLAYPPASPGTAQLPAANSVVGTWQDSSGSRFSLGPIVTTTYIAQPYLNNTAFGIGILNWISTSPSEVESTPVYTFSLANTGPITAYEVKVSFQLPPSVSYQGQLGSSGIQFLEQPSTGDTGALTFTIKELPNNLGTVAVNFNTRVENTAMPGNVLSATLSLSDYSSQPDGTGVYDRHYGAIPAAIPPAKSYGFLLKGLTAIKSAAPVSVQPGQLLTYSILYSNTSVISTSTNVLITDTYDSLLNYVSSTSLPDAGSLDSNIVSRTLTWHAGTLSNPSASYRITATFQVTTDIGSSRMLTNTIMSDWDSPAPAMSRSITTTLVQAVPSISLDDKGVTVTANSLLTYTLIYSNASAATGATTGTFTITLDYDPNITFITSTGRSPVVTGTLGVTGTYGTTFTDTLGAGISRTVLLRMQVARPLPYTLTSLTSTAAIYQPTAEPSAVDDENTPVNIPIFTIVKTETGSGFTRPGAGLTYRIYVTNTGEVTATNIVITDVWDANTNTQAGGGSPSNWTISPKYGTYIPITLTPGATLAFEALGMNVNASLPSNAQTISNVVQLTSRDTTQQEITYDIPLVGIYIQKSHQPNDVIFPGKELTYTIAYTMVSDAAAASPFITDALPSEVTYVACYGGGSPCTHVNGTVTWSWGSLGMTDTGVVTVVVLAPNNTEWITLTNNYASNFDSPAAYREGEPDLTYVGRPHLSISKVVTTAVTPVAPGDLITYTLTYTNFGSYKSTGTQAFDTVPANTTYESCAGGSPCDGSNGLVTWALDEVPITTTGTLTMVVRVKSGAGTTTLVNSDYSLTADRAVVNEGTPPSISTSVVRPALTVHKSVSPTWIALAGTVTYTVQYTNTGGGTFTSSHFTDTIDSRLKIESISGNCATLLKVVSCTDNSNLAPGQSRQFTITVGTSTLSANAVVTNAVDYVAANQTETLPVSTSNTIEVPSSDTSAAADFFGVPLSGAFPLTVTFTNQSTGSDIISYEWNFGDGTTSNTATVSPHVYTQPGVYTVTLKITTGSGANTRTRPNYITVTGKATPTVAITGHTANPSVVGESVTITFTVTPPAVMPPGVSALTGLVTVTAGADNCSASVAIGHCAITTFAAPGMKTLTATYGGDANFISVTSSSREHTVNKASTTTSIASIVPTPALFGQATAITVSVLPVSPGSGTPGGTITVTDGTVNCSVIPPGTSCDLTFNVLGSHTLTATYSGDTNFTGSFTSTSLTVVDVPISNLTANNSSPTRLDDTTFFTATATGTNIIYTWNFGDGSFGNGADVAYTYTLSGTYSAIVTATNSVSSPSMTTPVTITNQPPVAVAADIAFSPGSAATLDGSLSFDLDNHYPLTYDWAQTGDSSTVIFTSNLSVTTFTAPSSPTVLTFTLTVTDAHGLPSLPVTVTVTINNIPITGLAAQNSSPGWIGVPTAFTATVATGSSVEYVWNFGDESMTTTGRIVAHPYAALGTYTATVTATNSQGTASATTPVTITNQPPVAVALDIAFSPSSVATLDGRLSFDPDSDFPLTYDWAQTGGGVVSFTPILSVTTFTAPSSPTVLTFTLTVTDAYGLPSLPETVIVTIDNISITGLAAENSSPTDVGVSTAFVARVAAGSSVEYGWNFGDGVTTTGWLVAHTYTAAGHYTAIVTATNTINSLSITTPVTITKATPIVAITSHTPNPSVVGESVTINFSVTPSGSIIPTGSVTVTAGADNCSANVATGQCPITFALSGTKTLTAQYSGDTNFKAAATLSGVAHTVDPKTYTLTVATVGNGSVSPTTSSYISGTIVSITATANPGSTFTGWSGAIVTTTNPTTIAMTGNKSITATFSLITHTLTVVTAGNGIVTPTTSSYISGTIVSITATANAGSTFTGWSGAIVTTTNPTTITMTGNKSITATFSLITYTLTVATAGNGSVSPTTSSYISGAVVPITATANAGSTFTGWSGALNGSANPTSITMTGHKSITATFALNTSMYTLTVAAVGNGSVSPAVGTHTYTSGTDVLLTATPDAGGYFGQWSGAASGTLTQITVTMNADKVVTATFFATPPTVYTLTMGLVGNGVITPTAGAHSYVSGTLVDVSASPAAGWQFAGWTGALNGTSNPTLIQINGNKSVTATFASNASTYTLTVATTGAGSGTVIKSPDAINYAAGSAVILTATANTGSTFTGWSGDLSGSANPISITMTGDKSITATFALNTSTATTTSLTSAPNPSVFGQNVTFTATVTAVAGMPSGTVTFKIDDAPVSTSTLSNSVATYNTATLAVGVYSVTATYNGDTNFTGSVSNLRTHTVIKVQYPVYLPLIRR